MISVVKDNSNALRPFFRALTEAVRSVAGSLTDFVAQPHTRVPEGLHECAQACLTLDFVAGHRFLTECVGVAIKLRDQPSSDGFRLLAASINAIGVHCRSLAQGTETSYASLNKSYRRLYEYAHGVGAADGGESALFMPMFRSVDAIDGWIPPKGASEEAVMAYLGAHLHEAIDMDVKRLQDFFRSLEARNSSKAVKVFIDAAICTLEEDNIEEECLAAIGHTLSDIAEKGYHGLDVHNVSRLLCHVSGANLHTARAKSLQQHVLSEFKGTEIDVDLARKFGGALDKVRDILKQAAGSGAPERLGAAAKQLANNADMLGSVVVSHLASALVASSARVADRGPVDEADVFWIHAAMAVTIQRHAIDLAMRGLPEDSLLDLSSEVERRLSNEVPLSDPLPEAAMILEDVRNGAIAHLNREAGLELTSARSAVEAACAQLDSGRVDEEHMRQIGADVARTLETLAQVLQALNCPHSSALASHGATIAGNAASWSGPAAIVTLTDVISTLTLGFERLHGSSTPNVDALIVHEIATLLPDRQVDASPGLAVGTGAGREVDASSSEVSLAAVFFEEAKAHLDSAESLLLGAQRNEEVARDMAWVHEYVRVLHSLRGGANVAGLNRLGELAGQLEDGVIQFVESCDSPLDASVRLLSGALDSITLLSDLLDCYRGRGTDTETGLAALEERIRGAMPFALVQAPTAAASVDPADDLVDAAGSIADEGFVAEQPEAMLPPEAAEAHVEIAPPDAELSHQVRDFMSGEDEFMQKAMGLAMPGIGGATSPEPTSSLDGLEDLFSAEPPMSQAEDLLVSGPAGSPVVLELGQAVYEDLAVALDSAFETHADQIDKLHDRDLFVVLSDEVEGLLPTIEGNVARWSDGTATSDAIVSLRRDIHTLKGAVRLGGMLRAGAALHALEDLLDSQDGNEAGLAANQQLGGMFLRALTRCHSDILRTLDSVRLGSLQPPTTQQEPVEAGEHTELPPAIVLPQGEQEESNALPVPHTDDLKEDVGCDAGDEGDVPAQAAPAPIDSAALPAPVAPVAPVAHPVVLPAAAVAQASPSSPASPTTWMRVPANVVEGISRDSAEAATLQERAEEETALAVSTIQETGEHIERAQRLLKDLEIEAEIRIQAGSASTASGAFDPIEFDRFTRLQELVRSLSECIADISSSSTDARRIMARLHDTEAIRQAVNAKIQDRASQMLIANLATHKSRLDRVIKLACDDTGKDARLNLVDSDGAPGPVLDRLLPSIEHILRNSIAHGIESPQVRQAAGKPPAGEVTVTVSHTGAFVSIVIADDGAGIDPDKVMARAVSNGILAPGVDLTEQQAYALLFKPGFSTAGSVTQLAGRGVGLDVVQHTVSEIGGTVSIASRVGAGTSFTLSVPSDISSMSVVPVQVAGSSFLIPGALVDRLISWRRIHPDSSIPATISIPGREEVRCPVVDLARIVGVSRKAGRGPGAAVSSGAMVLMGLQTGSPVAFLVDDVRPQRKITARPMSPLISSLPGIVAGSVDAEGSAILVINPLRMRDLGAQVVEAKPESIQVMLVDDSSTVRMNTSQALRREGFSVITAKDGLDALEQIERGTSPDFFIFDLEMPRLDGFELTKAVRAIPRFADTPIYVVSSRAAEKHKNRVFSLGATGFMAKPVQAADLAREIISRSTTALESVRS